jgi:hypothetical protein
MLQKSFRGGERKFLEPLMRLARGDVNISFHPKSITDLRSSVVVALKSDAAAEKSKDQLSRDF